MHQFYRLLICLACLMALAAPTPAQVVSLPTAQAALVGRFARGPFDLPLTVNFAQFQQVFGSLNAAGVPAEVQAREFFANGGGNLSVVRVRDTGPLLDALIGRASDFSGLNALAPLSDLRILLVPEISLLSGSSFTSAFAAVRALAEPRRIFFILDPPPALASASAMVNWINTAVPDAAQFCAVYFPYLQVTLDGVPLTVPPCGAMAAIYATSDTNTAIWKSPAGSAYPLQASGLTPTLNSNDADNLNVANVNAIRQFTGTGIIPFGGRTLDRFGGDTRYISVVRTLQWSAAAIQRSLAFAATRADAAPLWTDIQTLTANFLHPLFVQGAFLGSTPAQAYYAACDASTTTAADIAAHRVNLLYGMALLRPSEFDVTQLVAVTSDSSRLPSVPILRLRAFAGQLYLPYPTEPGFTYRMQTRLSLTSGSWSDVSSVTGDGAWRNPAIPLAGNRAFYQLLITPGS